MRRHDEAEHGEDNARLVGRVLRAAQLVEPRAGRLRLAVPRNPEADRLRPERVLPANDAERILRPLERVVGDADEQVRLAGCGGRAKHDDRRDDACDGEEERDGQSPRDARPRSDCIRTRQPVANTVRR